MNRASSLLGLVAIVALAGGFLLVMVPRMPSTGSTGPQPSEQPTASPPPAASAAPAPTGAAVKSGDCQSALAHLTTDDRASETVEDLASASSAAFAGTVTSIGPAEWNTPDGKPTEDTSATAVRRMATVKVKGNGKGVTDGSTVTVAFPGGTIGCDLYQMSGFAEMKQGDSVVLFVESLPGAETAKVTNLGMATVGWKVQPNGSVRTPEEGELTLSALLAKVPKD